jgi:vitamin K-dependent gamma-carboxylase
LGPNPSPTSFIDRLYHNAFTKIDAASVTFFRIVFGWMMAAWGWDYLTSGRVTEIYITPKFHFSYAGFEWLQPWPGNGMYLHFLALVLLALCISVGFLYRIISILFAIGFTLVFLMERTNYQNHYYLIALIAWMMPLLPLNRIVSIDAWIKQRRTGREPESTVSAWVLWVLQFHIALPYFFGGIAKISPDWLNGQPMGIFLSTKKDLPLIGGWLNWEHAGVLMSLAGLFFDLLVVPALLWKRTRVLAFIAACFFHLCNSTLFNIHVFPWFMIAASTLFFDPGWPRRVLGGARIDDVKTIGAETLNSRNKWLFRCAMLYVLFHMIWPLRHMLHSGDASWHDQGHLFSWRMMLRVKEVGIGYALVDPKTELMANVNHKQFMVIEQSDKFARDPRLIVQFAKFLAQHFEKELGRRPEVHAVALASLNGRKPQLLVDPNVDLARVNIDTPTDYVVPLTEKLREPPWLIPVDQWGKEVELPPIEFLEKMKKRQEAKQAKP